jgi:hypothetical protein
MLSFPGSGERQRRTICDLAADGVGVLMHPWAERVYKQYSVGRWEGDALVVDPVGVNEKTWLDESGHPHSDVLRIIERRPAEWREQGQDEAPRPASGHHLQRRVLDVEAIGPGADVLRSRRPHESAAR